MDLKIAGSGPELPRLADQIEAAGLSSFVTFEGFCDLPKVIRFMCDSDFLVLPSLSEPWGLVVNEAMQCECIPIVSDKVGRSRDLVEPGVIGFVFASGNVRALSAILKDVTYGRVNLRILRQTCTERIAQFNEDSFAEGFLIPLIGRLNS